jgi:rSAM/selenodomain-associated transferase 1
LKNGTKSLFIPFIPVKLLFLINPKVVKFVSMKHGIIIMAKVPEPGKVKTRLQPFLSPERCAELATCFLGDTVEKAQTLQKYIIVAFSPPEQRDFFNSFEGLNLVAQTGIGLGQRMFNAFQFAFQKGFEKVVMIGTDSPTFPPEFIENAFELLDKSDAVLGRTTDGGFYLIGLRKPDERIFAGVEWSSARTFEQTKRNLEKYGFTLNELPVWYDVDEPEDLENLKMDENLPRFAPRTAEWLRGVSSKQ